MCKEGESKTNLFYDMMNSVNPTDDTAYVKPRVDFYTSIDRLMRLTFVGGRLLITHCDVNPYDISPDECRVCVVDVDVIAKSLTTYECVWLGAVASSQVSTDLDMFKQLKYYGVNKAGDIADVESGEIVVPNWPHNVVPFITLMSFGVLQLPQVPVFYLVANSKVINMADGAGIEQLTNKSDLFICLANPARSASDLLFTPEVLTSPVVRLVGTNIHTKRARTLDIDPFPIFRSFPERTPIKTAWMSALTIESSMDFTVTDQGIVTFQCPVEPFTGYVSMSLDLGLWGNSLVESEHRHHAYSVFGV